MCPHKRQLSGQQNTGSRRGLPRSKELQRHNLKQSLTIALRRSREPSRNLPEFLTRGGVFSDSMIDAYLELKMQEVQRFRMSTHPIEFDMYYSV